MKPFPIPLPYEFKYYDCGSTYKAKRIHGKNYSVDSGTGYDSCVFEPEWFYKRYNAIFYYVGEILQESTEEMQLRHCVKLAEQSIEHYNRMIGIYEAQRKELEQKRLENI
jgi:hypothetical protein